MSLSLFVEEDVARAAETPILLRPYQSRALAAIEAFFDRGGRRGLTVMPTGTGKTTVFADLVSRMVGPEHDRHGIVLAHRDELISQGAARIRKQVPRLTVGVEANTRRAAEGSDCVVASVATLGLPASKRLEWLENRPKLIITDEAHHSPADVYQNIYRRFGAYAFDPNIARLLGVTATPHRLDNKPLHGVEKAIYEEVIYSYTLREAIKDGYLVDLKGYRVVTDVDLTKVSTKGENGDYTTGALARAVNVEPRNELAFDSWRKVAADKKTIVFCVDVKHARDMADLFRSQGISAATVDGKMRKDERDRTLRRHASGETQVLTNVEVCTEGYDDPSIECVLVLRPTKSWGLYAQMVGRGLRILPGIIDGVDEADARRAAIGRSSKPHCLVIDVVDLTDKMDLASIPEQGDAPLKDPSKAPPTIAGLVGLPPRLNLLGATLGEAIEIFEGLSEPQQNRAFSREITLDGLSAELTEVDLIQELKVTDEVAKSTPLYWLKRGPGRYFVDLGWSAYHTGREAELTLDPLGSWSLVVRTSREQWTYSNLSSDLTVAFVRADAAILSLFPGVGTFADRRAKWRTMPVSKDGRIKLMRNGIDPKTIDNLTRGEAFALYRRILEGPR